MNDKLENMQIPEGWERIKFSDNVFFQEGPGLMATLFKETGFPFMNIRCIENDKIKKENCQFVSNSIAENQYKHFQLQEDDLIVSTSGTLGKKAFVRKSDLPLLLNTSIIRFRPKYKNAISLHFLNYILESYSFLYDLYSQSTGSAQVNVGPSHIKKVFVTLPKSLTEQKKIAQILSTVDKAIEQTEQLIAKYQRIKTGLMQDLLTKGIDENGNIRSEETHEFKDSELGRIPVEWECLTINDIAERLRSGVTPRGGSNVYQEDGVMLIRSQNVYSYGFKNNDVAFISNEINDRMKGSELRAYDVLLNITGASIGRSTFVPKIFPKANVNQHVCSIRLKKDSLEMAIFLSTFLNSIYGQNQIMANNAGSNREGINYTQIREIKIPYFYDDKEFVQFKRLINKSTKRIQTEEIKLQKLQRIKTALMQDLLSGKKRVNSIINDE